MCQLAITTAFIGMFKWNTAVNNLVKANPGMWWIAMIMMFITLFALTCCGDLSRKSPHNIILLFLFTVAESFLVAMFTIHFQTDTVSVFSNISPQKILIFEWLLYEFTIDHIQFFFKPILFAQTEGIRAEPVNNMFCAQIVSWICCKTFLYCRSKKERCMSPQAWPNFL